MTSPLLPVILCGGSGTRLWPLSREHFPKQFISLMGQATLFQQTLQRLEGVPDLLKPMVIGNEEHRFLIREQMGQIEQEAQVLILEPEGRNTAPALTLAALWGQAHLEADNPLLLVMPSDHAILRPDAFRAAVATARPLAEAGQIVTFGVHPERPETGYGYIQAAGQRILAFKEKPDLATARAYFESEQYLWNAGIFLLPLKLWLQEIEHDAPEIWKACQAAVQAGDSDQNFFRPEPVAFSHSPACSIDYAVMEQTAHAAVVSLEAGWSDLGCWSALKRIGDSDEDENTLEGDVQIWDSHRNYLKSTSRLVAAIGVRDLIVVETPDAVLVADRQHAQDVRHIVAGLKENRRPEVENHLKEARPWGYAERVDRGDGFQVRRLTVHPGQALSLQKHRHRSEHWVVICGLAQVTRGEEIFQLAENQSAYIPPGVTHRLENVGQVDLELIEIQSGRYLSEEDVIRCEERYQDA